MIRRDKASQACRKAIPLLDRAWSEAYWLALKSTWTNPMFGTEATSETVRAGLLNIVAGIEEQISALPLPSDVRASLQSLDTSWDSWTTAERQREPWEMWADRQAAYKRAADVADRHLTASKSA